MPWGFAVDLKVLVQGIEAAAKADREPKVVTVQGRVGGRPRTFLVPPNQAHFEAEVAGRVQNPTALPGNLKGTQGDAGPYGQAQISRPIDIRNQRIAADRYPVVGIQTGPQEGGLKAMKPTAS